MVQDPRNFLFNSDYPMPALVWEYSGSITDVGSFATKSVTITHNLGFTPLLIGVWSVNSDLNPSYDIANYIGTEFFGQTIQLNACGANSTDVLVEAFNASSDSKSIYFRLLAFQPPEYTGDTPNVTDTTKFQFSTDYNYPKIINQGSIDLAAGATSSIEHKLGYIPQARVWGPDYNGRITPLYRIRSPRGTYGPVITSNDLSITGQYAGKYYYQIYGDEA